MPDPELRRGAVEVEVDDPCLAAQLTCWKIDIYSEAKHGEMIDASRNELARVKALDETQVDLLVRSGFQNAQDLADAAPAEVAAVHGVDDEAAAAVVASADEVVESLIMEEAARRRGDGDADSEEVEAAPEPAE